MHSAELCLTHQQQQLVSQCPAAAAAAVTAALVLLLMVKTVPLLMQLRRGQVHKCRTCQVQQSL
jgi:hypothetical protein